MKIVFSMVMLAFLGGCFCVPDKGEGLDSNYWDKCWEAAKGNH